MPFFFLLCCKHIIARRILTIFDEALKKLIKEPPAIHCSIRRLLEQYKGRAAQSGFFTLTLKTQSLTKCFTVRREWTFTISDDWKGGEWKASWNLLIKSFSFRRAAIIIGKSAIIERFPGIYAAILWAILIWILNVNSWINQRLYQELRFERLGNSLNSFGWKPNRNYSWFATQITW